MKLTIGGRTDTETSDVAVNPTGCGTGRRDRGDDRDAGGVVAEDRAERRLVTSPTGGSAGGSGGGSGTTQSDTRAKGTSTCGTST